MKNIIKAFLLSFIIFCVLCCFSFCTSLVLAGNSVHLDEASITYRHYFPGGFNPYINENGLENKALRAGVDVDLNISIIKFIYWDNKINSLVDQSTTSKSSQFRLIGWQYRFGVRPLNYLEMGFQHHSQHLLDTRHQSGRFGVEDAFEVRLYLLSSGKKGSIF